jgi:hypothetical protein
VFQSGQTSSVRFPSMVAVGSVALLQLRKGLRQSRLEEQNEYSIDSRSHSLFARRRRLGIFTLAQIVSPQKPACLSFGFPVEFQLGEMRVVRLWPVSCRYF